MDHILFWNAHDLENKLKHYQEYFNNARCHCSISGKVPLQQTNDKSKNMLDFSAYSWGETCRGNMNEQQKKCKNFLTAYELIKYCERLQSLPKYLSSDNDPLFTFHRWQANLRVLDIKEIKTLPFVPISHPFVERLIGSVRREILDQTLFWNAYDLVHKLEQYTTYYNNYRSHMSLQEKTPAQKSENTPAQVLNINDSRWKTHANGLFSTPIAA